MPATEIIIRYFKIDPKDIAFIKAVLESYEGMVVIRTVEVGKPIVEFLIARDFSETVAKVIEDLQKHVVMEETSAP
jgi:hypothetical protein